MLEVTFYLLEFQRGCQTKAVHRAEAEIQTVSTTIAGTQTEPRHQATEQLLQQNHNELESPGLKDFLQRVEDRVIRELVRNAKSHAFDGFQVNWEDHSSLVRRTNESNKKRCQFCKPQDNLEVLSCYSDSSWIVLFLYCRFHASIAFNIPVL